MSRPFSFVGVAALFLLATRVFGGEPPAPGLVAFWDFDGRLDEQAGAAKDTFAAKAGQPRFVGAEEVPGVMGRALALGVQDGDAAYCVAPPSEDLRLGPTYTVEAWIQPTALGTWNRLLLRWGPAGEYAYHVALHDGRASLYHNPADGRYLFAEGGRVVTGRWYHFAAVARPAANGGPATLNVFLNGRAVGSAPFDGTIKAVADEAIGLGDAAGAPAAGTRFRGYVDELAVWNRALEPAEIAAHFNRRAAILRELERGQRLAERDRLAATAARLGRFGCEEIIFAERFPGRDLAHHYYANFGYACTDPNIWLHGQDGGALCKLNLRTGDVTRLVDDPGGAVRDLQVDYAGRKVLFSYRPGGKHQYHLYEIGVDGANLRQITDGPWDDIEPAYLPDGDIVFCSSRAKRYIGCWLAQAATLHRCDPAGGNLRMLSSGAFTENTPSVLPDGRVLYTRWEYVNRDAVSFHHLWTMNPDGSGPMVFYGNQQPGGVFIDARPVPGSDRVAFIHSPGHGQNEHAGYVAMVSGRAGPNAPQAMIHVSREARYRDPFPLAEDTLLVARGNQVLLMDAAGRTDVLHTADCDVHEPLAVLPRPREPAVAPRVKTQQATGTVVLADVYTGRNMAGVPRGTVKKLLVLEDLPKPANYHGGGSQPLGHGVTSTLKRILGTVPVAPDGSACFEVPAARSIYFALLDDQDRSIKQMRSFVTVQPGEAVGCVGCHETRRQAPAAARSMPLAMQQPPSVIEPIVGVPEIPDFPRDIQPILDRHCVRCHGHERRDGGVSLVGDRGPVFSHAYYELLLHWQVKDTGGPPMHGTGRQPGNDAPYTTYSSASPLMNMIGGRHYEVRLDPREAATVRLWIDTNAQYAGTYAAIGTGQIGGCWNVNQPIREMADAWPSTPPAAEAVHRRCAGCHGNRLPRFVTDKTPIDEHQDFLSWLRPLSRFSRHRVFNLTRPEKSLVLLTPLARAAGGHADGQPAHPPQLIVENVRQPPKPIVHPVIFPDTRDPDYQKILQHVAAAKSRLDEIKRFDLPGFRPSEHYIREMKRYGVLPETVDPLRDPLDAYAIDAAYFRSFWHK